MTRPRLYVAVSAKAPRGAWSWRLVHPDGRFEDKTGTEAHATAYRLRLLALTDGLESLPEAGEVEVVTTDQTTITLCTTWLPAWASRDFRKKGIQAVDVVKRLWPALGRLDVTWDHQPRRTGDSHAKDCSLHAKDAAARMEVPNGPPPIRGSATVRGDVEVVAWTDGGSRKNPGPSGWGVVLVHRKSGTTVRKRGGEAVATNNRMELTAIAEALAAFRRPTRVEVRTDSRFAISAATEWRFGWKRRGWRKGDGEPPANLDVIQRLDLLLDQHHVEFTWVAGHTGEPGNELADRLCNDAIDDVIAGKDPNHTEREDTPPFTIETA